MRLPISQLRYELLPVSGHDELLLLETNDLNRSLGLRLVSGVVRLESDTDWWALPVADFEWLLLMLRLSMFGDAVQAEVSCMNATCNQDLDVQFGLHDYLGSYVASLKTPSQVRGLIVGEDGWYRLSSGAEFRYPTVADQFEAINASAPMVLLRERCVRGVVDARGLARVERTLERVAPLLSGSVVSVCPDCQRETQVRFDVSHFVLSEWRDVAQGVLDEVHLLASHYHWSEDAILSLPSTRRRHYIERIRQKDAA
jgi:hypothetical protein